MNGKLPSTGEKLCYMEAGVISGLQTYIPGCSHHTSPSPEDLPNHFHLLLLQLLLLLRGCQAGSIHTARQAHMHIQLQGGGAAAGGSSSESNGSNGSNISCSPR